MSALLDNLTQRYRAALTKEADIRLASLAYNEDNLTCIGGVWIMPLTLRHCAYLEGSTNAFIVGGKVELKDVGLFLWITCKDFDLNDYEKRDQFYREHAVAAMGVPDVVDQLSSYIKDAFQDAPGSGGEARSSPPIVSWIATLVDLLASEYKWSDDSVLDMPIARVWQYYRCISQRKSEKFHPVNQSDIVRREYLKTQYPSLA